MRIYNVDDFCLVKELAEATSYVYSVALSDKWLASGSKDNKVRIYDLDDFGLVKELAVTVNFVISIAFSDKLLVTNSGNEVVIHDIGKIKAFSAMHPMEIAPPEGGGLPAS